MLLRLKFTLWFKGTCQVHQRLKICYFYNNFYSKLADYFIKLMLNVSVLKSSNTCHYFLHYKISWCGLFLAWFKVCFTQQIVFIE